MKLLWRRRDLTAFKIVLILRAAQTRQLENILQAREFMWGYV